MDSKMSALSKNSRRKKFVAPEYITEISMNDILVPENPFLDDLNRTSENAPIIWERMFSGYRIVDLQEERMADAMILIRNDFLQSEPMCCATHVTKDMVSAKSYLQLILRQMRDLESLCALKEGTGDLVGVLVGSSDKTGDRNYNEIQLNQGQALSKIINLKNCLIAKARVDHLFRFSEFYQINVLCVETNHRNKGIGTALIRSCVSRINELRIPGCIAAFSSAAAQTIGERLNFEKLSEISYKTFVTPHNNKKPFKKVPAGNLSICYMVFVINSSNEDQMAPSQSTVTQSKSSVKAKRKR